jgi:aryl-alcohol dehydrogenase (NADP+)
MVKAGYRVGDLTAAEIAAPLGGPAIDHDADWRRGIPPTSRGLSRKHLLAAVDASLKRLGTDYIDLYQIHFWDDQTPIEETLDAMSDLVHSGRVRYVGCSQTKSWQLYRALWAAEVGRFQRFCSMQVRYNVFERQAMADRLEAAQAAGVAILAYSSLAGMLLSNQADLSDKPESLLSRQRYADMYWTPERIAVARELRGLGDRLGRSVAQLAQGWVLARPAVTAILIGPSTPPELAEEASVAEKPLTAEELAMVDAVLEGSPA